MRVSKNSKHSPLSVQTLLEIYLLEIMWKKDGGEKIMKNLRK